MSEASLPSYIDGAWAQPATSTEIYEVIDPATEGVAARLALCGPDDADRAIIAARRAFPAYSALPLDARIALMERLIAAYHRRYGEIADAITTEIGAPRDFSHNSQAECGPPHLEEAIRVARELVWQRKLGDHANLVYEPIGVCVLITPWNWPINQITVKVGPALIAGCTIVLKPSEVSPLSAQIFAECVAEAGYAPGVFNMLHGTGATIGDALTSHPEVDMVSFTGSTRAGIQIAKSAAETIKRVAQELGGKSANIVFDDAGLEAAVARGAIHCFQNSGQSCNAPTRMLVEASAYDRAVGIARKTAESVRLGDPQAAGDHLGPVANKAQYDKIQRLIQIGIDEGATLVAGGPGKPDGFAHGYYIQPTVFADVCNDMAIAQEEIFGPVLAMIPFTSEAEALAIANDTPYGLAGYVQSVDMARARRVAERIRAGSVHINGAGQDYCAPFGGYKQSGNGREYGVFGLADFLELKVINGFYA